MYQHAEVSRGAVLAAAQAEQLDLKLSFIQGGLGLLAECLQLLIQSVEES